MKNIAIITARSGSKGIKDKNIRTLGDKPLLAYSIEVAIQSRMFDTVHLSTDSIEYAEIGKKYGADVPFLRDESLATDNSDSWSVLKYCINKYKELGKEFETVTLLQPTSPLRNAADIIGAFKVFKNKNADSVISVCELGHQLTDCNILNDDGSMYNFIDLKKDKRRQEAKTFYRLNGGIFLLKTEILMGSLDVYGPRSYAYIMPKYRSIDIDDEEDFIIVEGILRKISDKQEGNLNK